MNTRPDPPELAPTIPPEIEAEASALIRGLSVAAGDESRVLDAMRKHAATEGGDITAVAAVALWLVFGRCLPGPCEVPELDTQETSDD